MMEHGDYFYGDLFKLMGMIAGTPFGLYLMYIGVKEKSKPAMMHALGWFFFLAALTPGESFIFQKIFSSSYELFIFQKIVLGFSGVCMTLGVSALVYVRNPKKLMYLGGASLILVLGPIYEYLGGAFFSGESFKLFIDVLHTAQYGCLLLLLGTMLRSSSQEKDFRMLGFFYASLGAVFLVYPFAKGVSITLRTLDIFIGFLIGICLLIHLSKIVKTKVEIIIPEKALYIEGMKNVSIVDKMKTKEILAKFESFPVLAFVRAGIECPKSWNVHIITNAPIENAISPTNLAFINELCVRYMRKARENGSSGVIYIECLEYLKLYNNFTSILKFLHALRDYAILYNGMVILEIDETAWGERELTLLRQIEA